MVKYVQNQTNTTVVLFSGKILIPIGGWTELHAPDSDSVEVADAVRRGWLVWSATKPGEAAKFEPQYNIGEPAVKGNKDYPLEPAATTAKKKK